MSRCSNSCSKEDLFRYARFHCWAFLNMSVTPHTSHFLAWALFLGVFVLLAWNWFQYAREKHVQIDAYAQLACAHYMGLQGQQGSPDDCEIVSSDASGLMSLVEYSMLYKGTREVDLIVFYDDGLLGYDVWEGAATTRSRCRGFCIQQQTSQNPSYAPSPSTERSSTIQR